MFNEKDSETQALGRRIKRYREQARLSSKSLADSLGMDPSIISKIESGTRRVSSVEIQQIARKLKVSALALLDENSPLGSLQVAARTMNTPQGEVFLEKVQAWAELHQVLLEGGIESKTAPLPPRPQISDLSSASEVISLASWARDTVGYKNFGTRSRFEALLEGIEAQLDTSIALSPESGGVKGLTACSNNFRLIYVTSDAPLRQMLFTLAHELGHLLVEEARGLVVDVKLFDRSDPRERFANAFAAEFLMPANEVSNFDFSAGVTPEMLLELATNFEVSLQVVIVRLFELGAVDSATKRQYFDRPTNDLINENMKNSLVKKTVRQGEYSRSYRAPTRLAEMARRGYAKGVIGLTPLAALSNCSVEDLMSPEDSGRLTLEDDPFATIHAH